MRSYNSNERTSERVRWNPQCFIYHIKWLVAWLCKQRYKLLLPFAFVFLFPPSNRRQRRVVFNVHLRAMLFFFLWRKYFVWFKWFYLNMRTSDGFRYCCNLSNVYTCKRLVARNIQSNVSLAIKHNCFIPKGQPPCFHHFPANESIATTWATILFAFEVSI